MKVKHYLFGILTASVMLCGCAETASGGEAGFPEEASGSISETAAANISSGTGEKSSAQISQREDISYYVTEAFCDGAAVRIENNSDSVLYLGSEVFVERNIGGEWQKLTSEGSGIIWGSTPAGFVKARSSETEIWHCGDLPDGDYRVIREAFFDDKNASGSIALAAEFSVGASVRSVSDYENERWEKENEAFLKAIDNAAAEIGEKSDVEISRREDVFFSVTRVLDKGVETHIENNGEMTLYWGDYFSVEKKVSGEWHTLMPIELPEGFGFAFHDIQYSMEPGGTRTKELYWSWYYGSLEPGDYRIIREFYFDDRSTFPDRMTLAAEFTIEQA